MTLYYALGDALVERDEFLEKAAVGEFKKFERRVKSGDKKARIEFRFGSMTSRTAIVKFKPIGLGKPLAIEIRHVYTGDYPKKGFFDDGKKDLLITSALKSTHTNPKAPRAVNHLRPKKNAKKNIHNIAATEMGSQLVYYSPSMLSGASVVTIELISDNFNEEFFTNISKAFSAAAGIPIFATSSPYLIAGSIISRLFGKLGEAIFDGKPFFNETEEILLFQPGQEIKQAGYVLLIADGIEEKVLREYKLDSKKEMLVNTKDGSSYKGPHPYVVLSFDGRTRKEYEGFKPTLASAEMLDRFFNVKGNQAEHITELIEGVKLYNDLDFRRKADEQARLLAKLTQGTDEHKKAKALYNAYVANILNDELKPEAT